MASTDAGAAAGRVVGAEGLVWRGGFGRLWSAAVVSRQAGIGPLLALAFALTMLQTLFDNAAAGVRELWCDRVLRACCLSVALGNIGIGALIASLVVVIKGWLGAGDFGYVVVTTGYGIGAVRALWVAALLLGLFGFAGRVGNVLETTVVQRRSPAALLGRISAAFRTVSIAGVPLGALLGGALAAALGPGTPALLAAVLLALGTVALIPVLHAPDGPPSGNGQIPSPTLGFARAGDAPIAR